MEKQNNSPSMKHEPIHKMRRQKRVFHIAKEKNISTNLILDFLKYLGNELEKLEANSIIEQKQLYILNTRYHEETSYAIESVKNILFEIFDSNKNLSKKINPYVFKLKKLNSIFEIKKETETIDINTVSIRKSVIANNIVSDNFFCDRAKIQFLKYEVVPLKIFLDTFEILLGHQIDYIQVNEEDYWAEEPITKPSKAANPKAVTQEIVTPKVVVPKVVVPQVVTPEVFAPEVVTQETVVPEVVTPEVVVSEVVTSKTVVSEVVTPEIVTPKVVAPEVIIPEVVVPEVFAQEIVPSEVVLEIAVDPNSLSKIFQIDEYKVLEKIIVRTIGDKNFTTINILSKLIYQLIDSSHKSHEHELEHIYFAIEGYESFKASYILKYYEENKKTINKFNFKDNKIYARTNLFKNVFEEILKISKPVEVNSDYFINYQKLTDYIVTDINSYKKSETNAIYSHDSNSIELLNLKYNIFKNNVNKIINFSGLNPFESICTDYQAVKICERLANPYARKKAKEYSRPNTPEHYEIHRIAMKAIEMYGENLISFLINLDKAAFSQYDHNFEFLQPKDRKYFTSFSFVEIKIKNASFPIYFGATYKLGKYEPYIKIYDKNLTKVIAKLDKFGKSINYDKNEKLNLLLLYNESNGKLYAGVFESKCLICSQPLTDPMSIRRGIGPCCAINFDLERRGFKTYYEYLNYLDI